MSYRITYTLIVFTVLLIVSACNKKSEYKRVLERELAKGVRYDSLFLGYKIGMKQREFYDHSWELNKKHLVREGPVSRSVQYQLEEELPYSALMYFYPDFKNDRIYRMRVSFKYTGWAPWNKDMSSDSLMHDVRNLMEKWYGDGFFEVQRPEVGLTYIKIDGNREIQIFKANEVIVNVHFTDLTAIQENFNAELNIQ